MCGRAAWKTNLTGIGRRPETGWGLITLGIVTSVFRLLAEECR